jgi:arsenate reductase
MDKPKVAFICVHNSCRSQIAEALSKRLASDVFDSFSAGTELKERIEPEAVRLMKELYGLDMEQSQRPKLIKELPPIDMAVTMGCNVECPYLPCKMREDWGLEDPTGKGEDELRRTIALIEAKIKELRARLAKTGPT